MFPIAVLQHMQALCIHLQFVRAAHEPHESPGTNLFAPLQAAAGSSAVWQGTGWLQLLTWLFEATA